MRSTHKALLILASTLCINSCAKNTPQPQPTAPKVDQVIGRVAAIYPADHYLLVQKYRTFKTDLDAVFYSRSVDSSVNSLKITGQRLGQYYIADISPNSKHAINDPVFMRKLNDEEPDDSRPDDPSITTPLADPAKPSPPTLPQTSNPPLNITAPSH